MQEEQFEAMSNIYPLPWTDPRHTLSNENKDMGNRSTTQCNTHRGSEYRVRLKLPDSGARLTKHNFL